MVQEKQRCYISGRVQGVCFRAATQEQAERLGVTGYARNLADGRVEVLACGPPAAVAQLREWLHEGPPAAQVEAVACEPADDPAPPSSTAEPRHTPGFVKVTP